MEWGPKFSKCGPSGDLILGEIGTKGGPWAAEMVTQWGPLKRIFENELSIEKKRIFVYLKYL